jgi:hypothetical protein
MVIALPDAHPVVPSLTSREPNGGVAENGWEGRRRRRVLPEAFDGAAAQRGVDSAVGPHQPIVELVLLQCLEQFVGSPDLYLVANGRPSCPI